MTEAVLKKLKYCTSTTVAFSGFMYIFYSCIYIYIYIYLKAEAFKAPNFLVFCARSGGGGENENYNISSTATNKSTR